MLRAAHSSCKTLGPRVRKDDGVAVGETLPTHKPPKPLYSEPVHFTACVIIDINPAAR